VQLGKLERLNLNNYFSPTSRAQALYVKVALNEDEWRVDPQRVERHSEKLEWREQHTFPVHSADSDEVMFSLHIQPSVGPSQTIGRPDQVPLHSLFAGVATDLICDTGSGVLYVTLVLRHGAPPSPLRNGVRTHSDDPPSGHPPGSPGSESSRLSHSPVSHSSPGGPRPRHPSLDRRVSPGPLHDPRSPLGGGSPSSRPPDVGSLHPPPRTSPLGPRPHVSPSVPPAHRSSVDPSPTGHPSSDRRLSPAPFHDPRSPVSAGSPSSRPPHDGPSHPTLRTSPLGARPHMSLSVAPARRSSADPLPTEPLDSPLGPRRVSEGSRSLLLPPELSVVHVLGDRPGSSGFGRSPRRTPLPRSPSSSPRIEDIRAVVRPRFPTVSAAAPPADAAELLQETLVATPRHHPSSAPERPSIPTPERPAPPDTSPTAPAPPAESRGAEVVSEPAPFQYEEGQELRGPCLIVQCPGDAGGVQSYFTSYGPVKLRWRDLSEWVRHGEVFKRHSWATHYKVRVPPENPVMVVSVIKGAGLDSDTLATWRRAMHDVIADPHRTLVRTIGYSHHDGDGVAVLQCYHGAQTLHDVVDDAHFTWKQRLLVARVISEGLMRLHDTLDRSPLVHGMLSPKSVMMSATLTAKIGHVGHFILVKTEHAWAQLPKAVDIQAAGLIFLQLLMGTKEPSHRGRPLAEVPYSQAPNQLGWPEKVYHKLHGLAIRCLALSNGPTAGDLVQAMQDLVFLSGTTPKDCMVCMDANRAVRLPCGHCPTCEGCTLDMLRTAAPCPLCRTPFSRWDMCDGSQTFVPI
jgi:hypothetical protein